MNQIGPNRPNWTELVKLDRIDLSGLYGPNRPNWTELAKLDRIDLG